MSAGVGPARPARKRSPAPALFCPLPGCWWWRRQRGGADLPATAWRATLCGLLRRLGPYTRTRCIQLRAVPRMFSHDLLDSASDWHAPVARPAAAHTNVPK